MIQCRRIVCPVAGYGNYGPFLLEQLDQTLFVHRTGTAHYFQVEYALESFFISQRFKFYSCDSVAFGIFRFPQADLACNLCRCSRSVTGNDLDAYSG